MRSVIERNQRALKGMLGGNRGAEFTLACRLELTAEEEALVRQYKLESYPVTYRNGLPSNTIGSMLEGVSQTLTDVTTLVSNENVIKDACDELRVLFDVVKSFCGKEIVEYPRRVQSSVTRGDD